MDNPVAGFAATYADARRKFIAAAESAGLTVVSHRHPRAGREGEMLAMDIAVDGEPDAGQLLIVSSGCHGVEGFAGSGVQVDALGNQALRAEARSKGVTVIHIHALNPYGFSYLRRTTEENVDLNRNFRDFSLPLPVNDEYRALQPVLLPEQWPPTAKNQAAMGELAATMGLKAFQSAVSRGQHQFADGLFYGGTEPCWSNRTIRQVLRQVASSASRLAWIDLHTGLGPAGVGERILACRSDPASRERARTWWGTGVTSVDDDSSVSVRISGPMWVAALEECPQAEYTGIALEYGTVPILEVLHALRAANWLHAHPEAPADLARQINRQLRDVFYVDEDDWKIQVVGQAREAMAQAIAGLAAAQ